ncbi:MULTISPECIES: type IV pilus biogenesis/stability protein PilW [unclassified Acidovorax]|uniref:type IV pilus biogenesis/stability protein PilW n=1 Tax=unclassified Acidovorax TaxID=2684926 RepID=UPI00288304D1|nr:MULTISPECIES: type IV pilus biogenesis/stability protein PilW [unclassified Acidovorax]
MTNSKARWQRVGAMAGTAFASMFLMSGCGTATTDQSAYAADPVVTPSDESEVRRRARIRLELAVNYFQMGQTTVALDEVKQAVATDPAFADAHHLMALVYMRLGNFAQAEESLRRAQGLKPGDPDIMHNFGWLQCQRQRYAESRQWFDRALAVPTYTARSKTLMSQGICLERSGDTAAAEQALTKAYELDAGSPVIGYSLASLKFRKGDAKQAQFYVRRVNNGEFANAESLWLGVRVERALKDSIAMRQLGEQLRKRFPDSRELLAYERGAFDE